MIFNSSIIDHERGKTIRFTISADRHSNTFFPATQIYHKILGSPMQGLQNGLALTGEIAQSKRPDLSTTGFLKLADELTDANIKPHFTAARQSIPKALEDVAGRMSAFDRPRFNESQSQAVRVEQRQHARTLPLSKLMELTQCDPDITSAIIEGGWAMSKLPADIFQRLRREMAVNNATNILSGQQNFQTAPSAADPVGGQPDPAAARLAGEKLISGLESERELIDSARDVLSSVVDAVAVLTDQSRGAAFARLID